MPSAIPPVPPTPANVTKATLVVASLVSLPTVPPELSNWARPVSKISVPIVNRASPVATKTLAHPVPNVNAKRDGQEMENFVSQRKT